MSFERAGTVALFGLPIADVTMAETLEKLEKGIASGGVHQIATANLDFARNALRDSELQRVICDCSMVLPDGAPMIWASRLFGRPLRERVTGVDLVPELARLSARKGYGIFLLGSTEKNTAAAAGVLEQAHPGVRIVGRYSPPVRTLEEMDDAETHRRIEAVAPDILLVAFGNPKQELWIHRNRKRLKVPLAIGIGGALEMIAGSVKRAPRWVQRLQMEWFFRMAQEPARLLPRYARDGGALLRHLPLGLAVHRMQPLERRAGKLKTRNLGAVRIVATPGSLTGEHCPGLVHEASLAAKDGQTLVIDLAATNRVEADGLGCLLQARRVMLAAGLSIWLAGMSKAVGRVLQFSAMGDLFRVAMTAEDAMRFSELPRAQRKMQRNRTSEVIFGFGRPIEEMERQVREEALLA